MTATKIDVGFAILLMASPLVEYAKPTSNYHAYSAPAVWLMAYHYTSVVLVYKGVWVLHTLPNALLTWKNRNCCMWARRLIPIAHWCTIKNEKKAGDQGGLTSMEQTMNENGIAFKYM